MLNMSFMKSRVPLLLALAMLLSLCVCAKAQQPNKPSSTTDDVRIARLAALGRLWGAVKFFHPYLAYRDVDWDKALIETIPRVNAARTPEDYTTAINHLLSFLNDKNTRAEIVKETKPVTPGSEKIDKENLVRIANGVLIIEAARIAEALTQDNAAFPQFTEKITAS